MRRETEVGPNDDFGLKVFVRVRELHVVFKVRSSHDLPDRRR